MISHGNKNAWGVSYRYGISALLSNVKTHKGVVIRSIKLYVPFLSYSKLSF